MGAKRQIDRWEGERIVPFFLFDDIRATIYPLHKYVLITTWDWTGWRVPLRDPKIPIFVGASSILVVHRKLNKDRYNDRKRCVRRVGRSRSTEFRNRVSRNPRHPRIRLGCDDVIPAWNESGCVRYDSVTGIRADRIVRPLRSSVRVFPPILEKETRERL